jgi:hypothetical protein
VIWLKARPIIIIKITIVENVNTSKSYVEGYKNKQKHILRSLHGWFCFQIIFCSYFSMKVIIKQTHTVYIMVIDKLVTNVLIRCDTKLQYL